MDWKEQLGHVIGTKLHFRVEPVIEDNPHVPAKPMRIFDGLCQEATSYEMYLARRFGTPIRLQTSDYIFHGHQLPDGAVFISEFKAAPKGP